MIGLNSATLERSSAVCALPVKLTDDVATTVPVGSTSLSVTEALLLDGFASARPTVRMGLLADVAGMNSTGIVKVIPESTLLNPTVLTTAWVPLSCNSKKRFTAAALGAVTIAHVVVLGPKRSASAVEIRPVPCAAKFSA